MFSLQVPQSKEMRKWHLAVHYSGVTNKYNAKKIKNANIIFDKDQQILAMIPCEVIEWNELYVWIIDFEIHPIIV